MIKRLSHTTLYVDDQNEALVFYTQKLGFELRTDITLEGFRWLTVGPPGQKDLELVLMTPSEGPMFDAETIKALQMLRDKGALGAGVFATDDCEATHEALKARGVTFSQPPTERPYGVEAMFKDSSGNWFTLIQQRG